VTTNPRVSDNDSNALPVPTTPRARVVCKGLEMAVSPCPGSHPKPRVIPKNRQGLGPYRKPNGRGSSTSELDWRRAWNGSIIFPRRRRRVARRDVKTSGVGVKTSSVRSDNCLFTVYIYVYCSAILSIRVNASLCKRVSYWWPRIRGSSNVSISSAIS